MLLLTVPDGASYLRRERGQTPGRRTRTLPRTPMVPSSDEAMAGTGRMPARRIAGTACTAWPKGARSMKAPILCVVACLTASVALAQGLGDAARKEQGKRKTAAESGAKAPTTYGDTELAGAGEGKGTFSANVADTSGDSEEQAPLAADIGSMPPAGVAAGEGYAPPAAEGSEQTDMDRFKATLARWRAAFQPLKARVDALEREVADLEAKVSRSSPVVTVAGGPIRDRYGAIIGYGGGGGGPRPLHEGEAARLRLPRAREELARGKQNLAEVEQQARRDGLAPGQLY